MIQYSLPNSSEIKTFLSNKSSTNVSFPSNQIDAVVGYFLKRGFTEQAARSTCIVLLSQARIDNINPFELIDSLKGLTDVQLSQIVTEVLNTNRDNTSVLGYTLINDDETIESRNIKA